MFRYASDQSLFLDRNAAATDLAAIGRIPGVVNLHPAYESILIVFNPLATTHSAIEGAIEQLPPPTARPQNAEHEIPVQYNGPDLDQVAQFHSLTRQQVIALHSAATYTVAFLGFVPGFAYLQGLPTQLKTPRLASPRKEVPAGSLGIAGDQTGIYPIATPGGWQLIGRTDVELFHPARTPMSLLQPGDLVRFRAV